MKKIYKTFRNKKELQSELKKIAKDKKSTQEYEFKYINKTGKVKKIKINNTKQRFKTIKRVKTVFASEKSPEKYLKQRITAIKKPSRVAITLRVWFRSGKNEKRFINRVHYPGRGDEKGEQFKANSIKAFLDQFQELVDSNSPEPIVRYEIISVYVKNLNEKNTRKRL